MMTSGCRAATGCPCSLHAAAHPAGVFHAHVLRAKDGAHQLHQHQADAPGGQQGFQRAAIQKADHAALQRRTHQRRGHEGHRHRSQQIPVKRAGQVLLEHALHHIGGVGANHHQLAVGHVDHAHQPVGDGQAQRHQQQDGAQADAAEHGAQAVAPGQRRFHRAQRGLERGLHIGLGLALDALQQDGLGAGVAAAAQQCGGLQAFGLVAAAQQRGGAHQAQLGLEGLVGLGGQAFLDQRQAGFVGLALQRPDGIAAHLLVFGEEFERGQRVVDLAAHAVVVDHVLGAFGHGQLGARHRVAALSSRTMMALPPATLTASSDIAWMKAAVRSSAAAAALFSASMRASVHRPPCPAPQRRQGMGGRSKDCREQNDENLIM
jgi:hypothetical protein